MGIPAKSVKRQLLRIGNCALSVLLVLGSIPAAAIGDGVTATYDEAYYAMTDYYGNLANGSVVKSYRTNGIATLSDYGEYDEVINLTDGTAPTRNGGKTTFRLDEKTLPKTFYFEGKTAKPFQQLPWTLSMSYTLNGVPARAEELAGKAGVVEIRLDAVPNERASEYARNNYTLEAMTIFNQDDILSLEAPGAQVQLIGNLRAAEPLQSSLNGLRAALGKAPKPPINTGLKGEEGTQFNLKMSQVKTLHNAYEASDLASFVQYMLMADGMGSAEAKELADLLTHTGGDQAIIAKRDGLLAAKPEISARAAALQALFAAKSGMSFRGFCYQVFMNSSDENIR